MAGMRLVAVKKAVASAVREATPNRLIKGVFEGWAASIFEGTMAATDKKKKEEERRKKNERRNNREEDEGGWPIGDMRESRKRSQGEGPCTP